MAPPNVAGLMTDLIHAHSETSNQIPFKFIENCNGNKTHYFNLRNYEKRRRRKRKRREEKE